MTVSTCVSVCVFTFGGLHVCEAPRAVQHLTVRHPGLLGGARLQWDLWFQIGPVPWDGAVSKALSLMSHIRALIPNQSAPR